VVRAFRQSCSQRLDTFRQGIVAAVDFKFDYPKLDMTSSVAAVSLSIFSSHADNPLDSANTNP